MMEKMNIIMDDITLFPPHFKLACVVGRNANMVSGWWFWVMMIGWMSLVKKDDIASTLLIQFDLVKLEVIGGIAFSL